MDILKKVIETSIWHKVLLMKANTSWKGWKAENSVQFRWWFTLEKRKIYDTIIVVRSVFNDGNQTIQKLIVCIDDCLYKLGG